jgi:hypothetical protein
VAFKQISTCASGSCGSLGRCGREVRLDCFRHWGIKRDIYISRRYLPNLRRVAPKDASSLERFLYDGPVGYELETLRDDGKFVLYCVSGLDAD